MNREPIALYIFRFVLGFGLFAFMCMLYWSSVLVEENLAAVRSDMVQMKGELVTLRLQATKAQEELHRSNDRHSPLREICWQGVFCAKESGEQMASALEGEAHVAYKNLLHKDPFFISTLPKMLGKNFHPSGIQHGATVGKPDNLHPFTNWSQVASWYDLCTVGIAKLQFGKYETFAPDMALRVEERTDPKNGAPEFWIHLRDNVFWKPLKATFFSSSIDLAPQFLRQNKVTAEDFKFFYDALMNPFVQQPGAVSLRTYYDSIEEIRVIDPLTFVVRWKTQLMAGEDGKKVPRTKYIAKSLTGNLRPLPSFVYKYFANGQKIIENDSDPDTYRTNSVWAQNFAEHWAKNVIISCGPWIFNGMSETTIRFERNPDFYSPYAALTKGINVDFRSSTDNIWQEFKNGSLDSYSLQPEQLREFNDFLKSEPYKRQEANNNAIKRLDYVMRSYYYIGWNSAKPFFNSAKLRQAMTMAIDRQRIIQNNLNGMGIEITGPFYRFSPAYDDSIIPWPFNPQQASRLLEEEGWYDSDGDGIIDKLIDGRRVPFRFTLKYYVKNSTTKAICEYIATALKEIGIECYLNGIDLADLSSVFDDKSFDALCMGWALGNPPEDPRQLWHSSGAKEKGSSNAVGFSNPEADAIIDQLDYEYDPKKRITLYHRFGAIIHQEQPYTFLYTPKIALLYREYLQNVFIPIERQDLVPGANIAEPDSSIFWIKKTSN